MRPTGGERNVNKLDFIKYLFHTLRHLKGLAAKAEAHLLNLLREDGKPVEWKEEDGVRIKVWREGDRICRHVD